MRLLHSLLFVLLSVALTAAAEEASTPPVEIPLKQITGLYYGRIVALEEEARRITVRAVDPRFGQRIFYIDRHTRYRVNRKPAKLSSLFFGDRVAVRYFGDEEVRVADAVFVVFGDFAPAEYAEKRRRKG